MTALWAPSEPSSIYKMESTQVQSHSKGGKSMRSTSFALATRYSLVLFVLALTPLLCTTQQPPAVDYSALFDKTEVMIPTRDGVKLHTEIYAPKNATGPLAIILERTPYGLADDDKGYNRKLTRYVENTTKRYIFCFYKRST